MNKSLKEICHILNENYCYFRNPKSHFNEVLGVETTNMLVKKGYLVDSPKIENIRDFDEPCYEFSKKFRFISNFHTCTIWEFIKYYIIHDSIEYLSEKFIH